MLVVFIWSLFFQLLEKVFTSIVAFPLNIFVQRLIFLPITTFIQTHPVAVCPSLRPYQQEDAHEFLLGLLSRMEENAMAGVDKMRRREQSETNVIRRIFGTVVRSEGKRALQR